MPKLPERITGPVPAKARPRVSEMQDSFRFGKFIKLGRVALWNFLTKTVVSGSDPTLELLKTYNPEDFANLVAP
jgi:hypothetical protein